MARSHAQKKGDGKSPTFPFKTRSLPLSVGNVAVFDEGEGDALVFVHGLVGDFTHFEHVVRPLAAHGYRLIGVDLPGCGASDKPLVRHSIRGYGETVVELLDRLGLERATLVGHSAGGAVVTRAALLAPERVERLALLSSAGLRRYHAAMHVAARSVLRRPLLEAVLERAANPLLDFVFAEENAYTRKFRQDALDRPTHPTLSEMAKVMSDLRADLLHPVVLDHAHELEMPLLVLWGDRDALVPMSAAREVARKHGRAMIRVLSSCGHMPMIEKPERVTEELLAFLRAPIPTRAPLPRRPSLATPAPHPKRRRPTLRAA